MNAPTVADLADELRKAHRIIGIALNCIEGDARRHFIDDVRAAGLEGEGVTRANERRALLERVEVLKKLIDLVAITDALEPKFTAMNAEQEGDA